MDLKTEYEFILPRGYVDKDGSVHRHGLMRLANAKDEIVPLNDLRVQRNRAYLIIVLLSRVITKLGDLPEVNSATIENLFAGDLRFLEEMYNRINEDEAVVKVTCPECGVSFEKEFGRLGESSATP
jgi:ssDNA-binding Zn-finger/Zn-ribbon topoisomerase 1